MGEGMRCLSLEERKKLLHEFHWPPSLFPNKVYNGHGTESECDYYKIPTKTENMSENLYQLTIKGFKTKAQVKAFIDWYEGQGEQDAEIWFECRKDEGEIDVNTMHVDCSKPYEWQDNTLIAWLKI